MNNKGFAVTGILYSILVLFIVLVALLMFNFRNRKVILDKLKQDTLNSIEGIKEEESDVITSEQVGITVTSDESITNVKEALDDLYNKLD